MIGFFGLKTAKIDKKIKKRNVTKKPVKKLNLLKFGINMLPNKRKS